jgi:hypothetical protein
MSEQPMDRMVEAVREAYHAPGASPYKSVAKKDKHLFRRLAFTVVGRYLPWVS